MTLAQFAARFTELCSQPVPLPGAGNTAVRHQQLFEVAREDLSLAKLVEAHWDALAILAEAGRAPHPGARYAVWASEIPGQSLSLDPSNGGFTVSGVKMFCSGAGLVDRALITAGIPSQLIEIDLRQNGPHIEADNSAWQTPAFALTNTSTLTFHSAGLAPDAILGAPGWYTSRPGFWNGACGPAACWAGGSAGLLDFALRSRRSDPHTLAHLGAIHANIWAMQSSLDTAGREIDLHPLDTIAAHTRALSVRHAIEHLSTDTLHRFARAFGPHPLSMDAATARRYQELDLYLRQSHAERDLESLGRELRKTVVN